LPARVLFQYFLQQKKKTRERKNKKKEKQIKKMREKVVRVDRGKMPIKKRERETK